ncbi:injection protein [Klebsiella aerogenes]|uniref:injection protein n=1 Tax=Klebsiella aerogenes TaxID=548 RepID=UPI00397E3F60
MKVTANGKTFTFPDGTSTEDIGDAIDEYFAGQSTPATQEQQPSTANDGSLASGFTQLATQQKEGLDRSAEQGASLGAAMREAVTGESRMTPELAKLQNVGSAPELNAFSTDALRAGVAQLFGSDASQEQVLQSMGATLSQDEKGNTIVNLPSGSYALNKPGLSPQDVTSFLANALAFTPASRAGSVLGAAAKSGATDLALQGATQAVGGEDINPYQTAISAGLGGAIKGLENTASAVTRATMGKVAPEKQAQIDFANKNNLPLMTTDVVPPETNIGKQARTLAERIPFAGTGGLRSAQQSARENLVKTFSDNVGGISDAQLYNSATKGQRQFINAAGKRYDRIINAMGDTPVDITNTVKAIDDQIARLTRPGASQDRSAVSVLQQFKDDITSGPNNLQLARENRTNLRKRFMAAPDEVDRDILQKASESVYKAYTSDMKKAVSKSLGPQEAENMARVDRSWAKFNDMMGNTRVQKAIQSGKTTPEDVTKLVFSQSPVERSQLYRLLDDNGRQNARAALVQRAVDKATDASGNVSVEKFINEMHRNRKQAATFFRGEHGKYLDGVMKYLDSTREAATGAASPLTGQLMAGPAALASMLNPIAAKAVATGVGVGLAGRTYESKVLRNAMLKLANTPKGSTAYDRAIRNVSEKLSPIMQATAEKSQQ